MLRIVEATDQELLEADRRRGELSLRVPCDTDGTLADRERYGDVAQLRMLDTRELWQEAYAKSRCDQS